MLPARRFSTWAGNWGLEMTGAPHASAVWLMVPHGQERCYRHFATISVISSCCSPELKRCKSATIEAMIV
jgi:hypothetical protein